MHARTIKILNYVNWYTKRNQRPPTIREIGRACNISSTSVVSYHLDKLEIAGRIEREPGLARAIKVVA